MRWKLPALAGLMIVTFVSGCGGSPGAPDPVKSPLADIENSVNDIHAQIHAPKYRPTADLGSDTDRIGMAFAMISKNIEGKGVEAEIQAFKDRLAALEKLAASKAPVDKQKSAAEDLKQAVAALKAKLQ